MRPTGSRFGPPFAKTTSPAAGAVTSVSSAQTPKATSASSGHSTAERRAGWLIGVSPLHVSDVMAPHGARPGKRRCPDTGLYAAGQPIRTSDRLRDVPDLSAWVTAVSGRRLHA